jgi:multidrug efflux pump subunit AcrA (membrane-fusion protein)
MTIVANNLTRKHATLGPNLGDQFAPHCASDRQGRIASINLKPGMTANVSIVVAQRKGILRVPNSALRFRPPEPQTTATGTPEAKPRNGGRPPKGARPDRKVHLLNPGSSTPEPVPVKLGISDNLYTEVLGGLEEGANLVTGLKTPPAAAVKPSANPMSGIPMRTR